MWHAAINYSKLLRMQNQEEIINRVAQSGLVSFDLSELRPKGRRIGIDLKDFLYEGLILREKDFRESVKSLDIESFRDAFVYVFCSTDAIVPLWAYFLLTSKLGESAKKVVYGSLSDLENSLMQETISDFDFSEFKDKRILVKGCSDVEIPISAYVDLVQKLKPIVKSLLFGEACSSVPIFKNS